MTDPPRRHIDATTLRGLAHPLRVQLYDALVTYGPATATMLAGRFGESTGSTSYHLRQLAKHGFAEEDPFLGAGRERFWRAYPGGTQLDGYELTDGGAGEATRLVVGELHRSQSSRLEHWLAAGYLQVPREWGRASVDTTAHLRLRADELAELGDELTAVLDAWRDRVRERDADPGAAAGTRIIEVQLHTFPVAARDVP